jgi:hypothetical protein
MSHFEKDFLKVALGLTSATVLLFALQAPAIAGKVTKPGVVLLAQNNEPLKEKQPSPATPAKEPREPKELKTLEAPPSPQMERMEKSVIRDEPKRSGTKKIGGQAIRAKEAPQGE